VLSTRALTETATLRRQEVWRGLALVFTIAVVGQVFPARVLVLLASLTCAFGLAAGLLAVLADF
jgi:hypothetical protein